ncbi:MAG: hypothetical protein KJ731_05085 [Alphaproteobacteria bacterium]|nr:hypothetical protein [Alphaproteobacteria bacterium]MBU1280204.1 hypothetical protein [Alphaproteobacteria bacterium]MBU1572518.1 hypothetical protein [Alphaproteobacteria bacterium]MBU1827840.1 hypothetical protein [Alphaproteobacteria bacterium]MBU2076803.1 hypothetical protein [Alphaproteobacteria bacterium]
MTVSVLFQASDGRVAPTTASRLALTAPGRLTLMQDQAEIAGFEKLGADLHVTLTDGSEILVENFFVIGPAGAYSLFADETGVPVVTGLMVPEADMAFDGPAVDVAHNTLAADAGVGGAELSHEGGDAIDPFVITGYGIGAAGLLFAMTQEDETPHGESVDLTAPDQADIQDVAAEITENKGIFSTSSEDATADTTALSFDMIMSEGQGLLAGLDVGELL